MQHKQIIIFISQMIRGVTNSRAALYQLSLLVCIFFYFSRFCLGQLQWDCKGFEFMPKVNYLQSVLN